MPKPRSNPRRSGSVQFKDMPSETLRFFRFAPHYALEEAANALEAVKELEERGSLRNGIYYVVLVDLVGSTKFGVAAGNQRLADRVEYFVTACIQSISTCGIASSVYFVKEIGDAVLMLFQHFPDIPKWYSKTKSSLRTPRDPIKIRVCVHVGEVYLDDANPICVAVSELFKLEKKVGAGETVLTHSAREAAWPTVSDGLRRFETAGWYRSAADDGRVPLWKYLNNPQGGGPTGLLSDR